MALHRIDADAEDLRSIVEFAPGIAQPAGLRGATGRVVLGIKIENDRGAAKILQPNDCAVAVFAADRRRAEIGCDIADGEFCRLCAHGFVIFSDKKPDRASAARNLSSSAAAFCSPLPAPQTTIRLRSTPLPPRSGRPVKTARSIILSVLLAMPLSEARADWNLGAESGALYDSNLANADRAADQEDDIAWKSEVTLSNGWQLARDWRLHLGGDFRSELWNEFTDFNHAGGGATAGLRYRFGLGPQAPWLLLENRLGYDRYHDTDRSGWDEVSPPARRNRPDPTRRPRGRLRLREDRAAPERSGIRRVKARVRA